LSARRVIFDNRTISGAQYFIEELDTLTRTKKSTKPQFIQKNLENTNKRVFGIGLTPDGLFRAEGIIEIRINEVRLLPAERAPAQGMLSSISALNIPIPDNFGIKIENQKALEVWVWNPDGNSAKINMTAFVGDIR